MFQLSHFLSFVTEIVIYYSPGPSRYWDSEKRRRKTIGSVLMTFHADATSSCTMQTHTGDVNFSLHEFAYLLMNLSVAGGI